MDSSQIIDLLTKYGYAIIFLLVIIEGPMVTIISSFLAASGYLNVFILYPLIVTADLFADVLWYFVGYLGRKNIVNRWGRFFGLTPDKIARLEKLNNKFKESQGKILFTAKITHIIGFPFLIAAGIFHIDIKKFVWFNFLATIPKVIFFMILGYYFGEASEIITKYLGYSTFIGTALLILSLASYILIQKFFKKFFKKYES